MDELQIQIESVLNDLSEQIVQFFEQDMLEVANTLMDQYIKLAPHAIERFSLEAMIRAGEADWDRAERVLSEGLTYHPLSFDLLYNLGFVYQNQQNLFEAYNMYMKARYVAQGETEKSDVGAALKGVGTDIRGSVKSEGDQISSVIQVGDKIMTVTTKIDTLLRRKGILNLIEKSIDKNASSVLEIGFQDGIISKNLNYFGFDVTAVDRHKGRMLNVMALEWHENILQPEQKVAKFYYELINLDWMKQIPEFDVIVAVGDKNLAMFDVQEGQAGQILRELLEKATNQLFITVAPDSDGDSNLDEFTLGSLNKVASELGFEVQSLGILGEGTEILELCLVNKVKNMSVFEIPLAGDVRFSKSTVFEVELDKCIDLYGAGYTDDFQHFVAVLNEYAGNPELKYEDSVLNTYYERFQPRNAEEALFIKQGRAPRLRHGWIGYPWLWDRSLKVVFDPSPGETRPGGNHHFGPNTDEFGEAEFKRLVPLYNILKEQGYHPELFADGYISGYLLVKGDDYRFVVTEGQHRMAVLAALGYEKIRCRFSNQPQYPHVVLWEDVKKWPQVANGVYSRNLALKIFERFFMKGIGKERMGME